MQHLSCAKHAVLQNRHIVKKVKGLKNHSHFGAVLVDFPLRLLYFLAVKHNFAGSLALQFVNASQKR